MQLSDLVKALPPYHFADAKKKIADRQAAGVDVISLSMGDPDLPAPPEVVESLCAAMQDTENHR
ncbi:MAG: LL-diaminopimelate aminotransferase, partial [Ktedonobacteraceae bacterium]|nr:LL-diaminopimelate aminotransferase [Ktedonobacteraceae bacterium]